MRLFHCEQCGQVLFFENSLCTACQSALGYVPEAQRLVVLPDTAEPAGSFPVPGLDGTHYVRCRNYSERQACNWLVAAPAPGATEAPYCRSCQLTELIPDLSDAANLVAWTDIERAKRRLLYTLYALQLPVCSRLEQPQQGVTFRFLRGTKREPVMTGHSGGVITLNVAEAHAAYRENTREKLGEAYRTVLGHLRHEIGHYYWDRLIAGGPQLEAFRSQFGDERQDYQQAINRHYDEGPPASWAESFISAYAAMHPWEDWAETWAHYLHMHDTLETAKSHGVAVRLPESGEKVATEQLTLGDFEALAASWHALTLTLNSLNRSMGLPDAYPFVLSKPVQEKLRFVHALIHEHAGNRAVSAGAGGAPATAAQGAAAPSAAAPSAAASNAAASEQVTGDPGAAATSARAKPASSPAPAQPAG